MSSEVPPTREGLFRESQERINSEAGTPGEFQIMAINNLRRQGCDAFGGCLII